MKNIFLFVLLIFSLFSCGKNKKESTETKIDNYNDILIQKTITHAMGQIGGYNYTNSYEAFIDNYNKGARVFEVDFDLLDDHLICSHDEEYWRRFVDADLEYNYDNFMNTLLKNKYQTLDIDSISNILNEYEDIYIVTDTKYFDYETVIKQFDLIYSKCKNNIERIIPQIYTEEMFDYLNDNYKFKSMIFTLYKINNWDSKEIAQFMNEKNIPLVTMRKNLCTKEVCDEFKKYNIKICAHTVDKEDEAELLYSYGCDYIYSNRLIQNK